MITQKSQSFYCISTVRGNECLFVLVINESGLLVLRCDCVKEVVIDLGNVCSLFQDFVTEGVVYAITAISNTSVCPSSEPVVRLLSKSIQVYDLCCFYAREHTAYGTLELLCQRDDVIIQSLI